MLARLTEDEIPKFTIVKLLEIFDQSNGTYNPNKDIRFKTPHIRDDLCDFNDAYIVVTGKANAKNIIIPNNTAPPTNIVYSRKAALKNSAPFFNCTLKINNQLIEDAQDLDIVNPMYNLLYYSKNFRKTTGSFWNYYPDKPKSGHIGDNEMATVIYSMRNSESFDYKTKLVDELPASNDPELNNTKFVVPLKNLSSLKFLMINTEIELILKRSQNCVFTEIVMREGKNERLNPPQASVTRINTPSDLKFNITDFQLFVPAVTLQEKYGNKLFEGLKTGIDIHYEWKWYRTQPATSN